VYNIKSLNKCLEGYYYGSRNAQNGFKLHFRNKTHNLLDNKRKCRIWLLYEAQRIGRERVKENLPRVSKYKRGCGA